MEISDLFIRYMDWTNKGSLAREVFLIGATVLTPTILPAAIFMGISNAELNDTLNRLNIEDTVIFTSVNDCIEKGYLQSSCQDSKYNADDVASSVGTMKRYNSPVPCAQEHGDCTKLTNGIYANAYVPLTSAWQAVANDISVSVPLYNTYSEDVVVRKDGRQFTLQ